MLRRFSGFLWLGLTVSLLGLQLIANTCTNCQAQTLIGINATNPNLDEGMRVFRDLVHFAIKSEPGDGTQDWGFVSQAGSINSDGIYFLSVKGKDVKARDSGCWAKVINPDEPAVYNTPVAGKYNPDNDTSNWLVVCPKDNSHPSNGIQIKFSRAVTDVHLYQSAGDTLLSQKFIDWMSDKFDIFRLMDLELTNQDEMVTLNDIPLPTDVFWGGKAGIPPATFPQISKELKKRLYLNFHATLDEQAMQYHVNIIKDMPYLTYIELGNEAWNFGMKGWSKTRDRAKALGYTSVHNDDGEFIRPYLAAQYKNLHKQLVAAGVRNKVKLCLSCQLARPEWDIEMMQLIGPGIIDVLVGSPYYQVPMPKPDSLIQENPNITSEEIIRNLIKVPTFSSVGDNDKLNLWTLTKALEERAAANNCSVGAYEFNLELHGINPQWLPGSPEYVKLLATKIAVHESPEHGEVLKQVLNYFKSHNYEFAILYKGPGGYYGFESLMSICQHYNDLNTVIKAILDWRANNRVILDDGIHPSTKPLDTDLQWLIEQRDRYDRIIQKLNK